MADLVPTVARIRMLEVIEARLIPMIADEDITRGQPVYRKPNGRAGLARANAVATAKVVGVATFQGSHKILAHAGEAFEALMYGRMVGWDLSAIDPGKTVYLSFAAAGAINDTKTAGVGNVVVPLGTVHEMTDVPKTRFVLFDIPQNADPVAL